MGGGETTLHPSPGVPLHASGRDSLSRSSDEIVGPAFAVVDVELHVLNPTKVIMASPLFIEFLPVAEAESSESLAINRFVCSKRSPIDVPTRGLESGEVPN